MELDRVGPGASSRTRGCTARPSRASVGSSGRKRPPARWGASANWLGRRPPAGTEDAREANRARVAPKGGQGTRDAGKSGFDRPVLKHGPRSPARMRAEGWQARTRSEGNRGGNRDTRGSGAPPADRPLGQV